MEPFTWVQAQSLLERWGWSEDLEDSQYWVQDGRDRIMVPTVENLECRNEYDDFVTCLGEIYGLNLVALEESLKFESC